MASTGTKRRLIQLYSALLYNAHLKGFAGGTIFTEGSKALCVPGLNCYSCPGAVGACPLGALQNALSASGRRAGFYVIGILLLFGLTLGRTVCGWLCPFGVLQELLYKLPLPKLKKSRVTRALTGIKYILLAVFVLAVPLAVGLRTGLADPAFCKFICPAGTLEGALPLLAHPRNRSLFRTLGMLFTGKMAILMLVGLACAFCYRSFCRFLCPLGAIYSLFHRIAVVGVWVEPERCNGCGACVRSCKMDVRRVGDRECIHCAACAETCPQKAISLNTGIGKRAQAKKARSVITRLAWGAAAALLCAALFWCNRPDKAEPTAPPLSLSAAWTFAGDHGVD